MPGFDGAALSHMRNTVAAALDKTCAIQARDLSNGTSGQDENFTNRATGVPCSLHRLGQFAVEQPEAGGVHHVSTWLVRMSLAQVVEVTDRIVIDSRTFEVLDLADGSHATLKLVVCVEIT